MNSLIDHKQQAFDLLLSQYQNSPTFIKHLNAFLAISQDIEDQYAVLLKEFNLEDAEGDFLNAIGELIGLPRFSLSIVSTVFQFDITAWELGYPYGDNPGDIYTPIPDDIYFRALKSWIITNNTTCNTNDLISALAFIFDCTYSHIAITETISTITITLDFAPDYASLSMYNYVTKNGSRLFPKIAGVGYTLVHP